MNPEQLRSLAAVDQQKAQLAEGIAKLMAELHPAAGRLVHILDTGSSESDADARLVTASVKFTVLLLAYATFVGASEAIHRAVENVEIAVRSGGQGETDEPSAH